MIGLAGKIGRSEKTVRNGKIDQSARITLQPRSKPHRDPPTAIVLAQRPRRRTDPRRNEPRQYGEPRDDGPKVVGFGSDMPAFLMQASAPRRSEAPSEKAAPVKKPRAPRRKAAAPEA